MNVLDLPDSSWGRPQKHHDTRALRRYNQLLRHLARAGEIVTQVLIVVMCIMFVGLLYVGNFENAIFADGTSLSCIFDGATGKIVNVK